VTVLEQSSELGEVGAGIQLPPNAMKVFKALGLEQQITRQAFRPEALEVRMGTSGLPIFRVPLNERTRQQWGASYYHIHRADYIEVLKQALLERAPGALKLDASVSGYEQSPETVSVHLQNSEQIEADVLIGADGIHSLIRQQMLGADKAEFTGNVAWRAVVPIEALGQHAPDPTACVWMGRGRHAVTYRLRGGELANFVGVIEREDWTKEGWSETGTVEEALQDFGGWHPVITSLIRAAKPEALYRWALFHRRPLATWTEGRAALLGDAAHPMLPFMAQGAAMAVEDAWALAAELSIVGRPVSASLEQYQARRYARARKAQSMSLANAKTFHQPSSFAQIRTYAPMWLAGKIAPQIIRGRLNELYQYDVTKT